MIRAPRVASRLARLGARCNAAAAAPATTSANVPALTFNQVKFQKEDVEQVMLELPAYNFYEMKEHAANPYKGSTLDKSILLDPPAPVLSAPKAEFSKLENGLTVASVDKQGLTARLALYVNAGSRFETAANFGVSHFASLLSYTSTAHLSHLRTVKTLEQLGANSTATCKAGREEIVYQVDVPREFVPLVVPLIVGNVLFPRLLPWEVKAAAKKVKDASYALKADPDAYVSELLHRAAFCSNTLGQSPVASERSLAYFTPDTVRSFFLDHFAPERMVLVGVNVPHAELSKWAMRSFVDYNAIPLKKRDAKKALYTGGDLRIEGSSPYLHLAIALESTPWAQKDLASMAVLQSILGGGSRAGALPGSGVTSRLSTQVARQNPNVHSIAAFNTSYSDSGVFGIYGVAKADKGAELATAITSSLKGLATVSKDELTKAKALLKGRLLQKADTDDGLLKDLGQQLLLTGSYVSVTDFLKTIDGVSEAEVAAAAKKLLASKPTVAAYGDVHSVPHYSAIEAALKA